MHEASRRPLAALAIAAAALAGSLALAACGGDDGDSGTETVTETVGDSGTGATAPAPDATATAPPDEGAAPPDGPGTEGPGAFKTPTGNIGCVLDTDGVRCDIGKRVWEPPPPSEPCSVDYGQGIAIGTGGGAAFVCAGDTTLGASEVLAYGRRAQRGPYFCDVAEAGVSCARIGDGAGFFLSRERYEIF